MKRVLMIAFHFPPYAGGSGLQRTLRFVQHLRTYDWEPIVLTAHPMAYERTSPDLVGAIPEGISVTRTVALDAARHLSLKGRFLRVLALPDRWMTWRFSAVRAGVDLVRRYRPCAIWSTYPIATAHVIANAVRAKTGLPWLADFRDPMAQDGYPSNPRVWRSFKRIEEITLRKARFSVFTTPGAARSYSERYPDAAERIRIIENGFDEESFSANEKFSAQREALIPGAITLLHSGIVYPSERDPTHLFQALRQLDEARTIRPRDVRIRFRAAVHDKHLLELAERYGVASYIEVLPSIPYVDALEEMMRADGLLVLQASNCNAQIPAKTYEYLRAGRPIIGLTDPVGDTAGLLRAAGADALARLDSAEEIAVVLCRFIADLVGGRIFAVDKRYVQLKSRRSGSQSLAKLLDEACDTRQP